MEIPREATDAEVVDKDPPPGALTWRRVLPALPLVLALAAATVAYLPSLNSAFWGDDYVYLISARQLSVTHYFYAALVPGSADRILLFTDYFWRPLYFLSYLPLERLFGSNVVPYHLVILAIHLAGVTLVWMLAHRLTGRWLAAAVAGAIFAVDPVGIGSVTWISSLNSAALPFGLASWLCFVSATEAANTRRRWMLISVSVLLFALSVGFRETGVVFLSAMAIWYVLVPARMRLSHWRTWLPLGPFVLLGVAYLLVRTRLFTIPVGNPGAVALDLNTVHQVLTFWKFALVPIADARTWWAFDLQRAGVGLLLLAIPVSLLTRRWLLLALVVGFLISVVPYSLSVFGASARYFYFPSALFALAAGEATVEVANASRQFVPARVPVVLAGAVIVVGLALMGYETRSRVQSWIDQNPDVSQTWLTELRTQYPTLPSGGTLYVANGPLIMVLFGGYVEDYTVWFYYPQVAHIVHFDPAKLAQLHLGPRDRVFVYQPHS